jgi:large subunit ribosomal protein L3
VEVFDGVTAVDVTGISKGHGFQGIMRRYGAKGAPASHGASKIHRRVGSIGASASPSRVVPGIKMPGQMGAETVTAANLKVVRVDKDNNLLLVRGAVPGSRSGFVVVKRSRKADKTE